MPILPGVRYLKSSRRTNSILMAGVVHRHWPPVQYGNTYDHLTLSTFCTVSHTTSNSILPLCLSFSGKKVEGSSTTSQRQRQDRFQTRRNRKCHRITLSNGGRPLYLLLSMDSGWFMSITSTLVVRVFLHDPHLQTSSWRQKCMIF